MHASFMGGRTIIVVSFATFELGSLTIHFLLRCRLNSEYMTAQQLRLTRLFRLTSNLVSVFCRFYRR